MSQALHHHHLTQHLSNTFADVFADSCHRPRRIDSAAFCCATVPEKPTWLRLSVSRCSRERMIRINLQRNCPRSNTSSHRPRLKRGGCSTSISDGKNHVDF